MAYNPWKLGYGLNAGTVVDPLPAVPNQGLPQDAGAAQQQWEDYMTSSGKSPAGFGGKGLSDAELAAQGRYTDKIWKKLSEEERIAATLPKMRDVLKKYEDPRWRKFIDAAGINIDKVKAFVNANSSTPTGDSTPTETVNDASSSTNPASTPFNPNQFNYGNTPAGPGPSYNAPSIYPSPSTTPTTTSPMSTIPSLDPSTGTAGQVTTPGTMPNAGASSPKLTPRTGPLGGDPLGLGSILPNQGTNRGYKPNLRRYF